MTKIYVIIKLKRWCHYKKINNAFNISFGEEPEKLIERSDQLSEVIDTFTSDTPTTKTLILTGPSGCGKTVLLAQ